MRTVLFRLWRFGNREDIHPMYRNLFDYPPRGYEFILEGNRETKSHGNRKQGLYLSSELERLMDLGRPYLWFMRDMLRGKERIPKDVDIVFSMEAIKTETPWVVGYDVPSQFSHRDLRYSWLYQKLVDRSFGQDSCKRILAWCEASKREMITFFDCSKFEEKIDILRPAIPSSDFERDYDKETL